MKKSTPKASEFCNLILVDSGREKIKVIKIIREVTGLGLKEAKDCVDYAPTVILENINYDMALQVKYSFEAVGAQVEIDSNGKEVASFIKSTNNDFMKKDIGEVAIKCPNCNAKEVKKISGLSKAGSVGLFGIFALGKLNKTYECKKCKYRW